MRKGYLKQINNQWYVCHRYKDYPLHPFDMYAINNGYLLSNPKRLQVYFDLIEFNVGDTKKVYAKLL